MSLELAIVLAAGEGTRMKSATAKVLFTIAGKSIIDHVLTALKPLAAQELRVLVGAHRESVEANLAEIAPMASPIFQAERKGTGHGVQIALQGFEKSGTILILAGDTPLITSETLAEFLQAHIDGENEVSVLTALLPDPTGYGRILRDEDAALVGIVEERDASEEERTIEEVNTGVYLFNADSLRDAISQLTNDNSQGELYLTDVISIISESEGRAVAVLSNDYTETLGINDRAQWAECAAIMRERINAIHMKNGVSLVDPTTIWIDSNVTIEADVTIYPGSALLGSTHISTGAIIGPRTTLTDVQVGAHARIVESNCTGSVISEFARVGPFSYLRAGTVMGPNSKAGAYVEIKNSSVGEGSKVPHLSYVGDATIGEGSNIGAATIFVNYDGIAKHRISIGNQVRIGSDTMLVAPVSVGDGAYTAAGSVITEDVPPGSMGVARARQRNILGWVLRKRSGTKSAEAAQHAGATESDTRAGNGAN